MMSFVNAGEHVPAKYRTVGMGQCDEFESAWNVVKLVLMDGMNEEGDVRRRDRQLLHCAPIRLARKLTLS
jgi:hypothetical protein